MRRSAVFEARYYATDAQRIYLRQLEREAFARRVQVSGMGTWSDSPRLTRAEASERITEIKTALSASKASK